MTTSRDASASLNLTFLNEKKGVGAGLYVEPTVFPPPPPPALPLPNNPAYVPHGFPFEERPTVSNPAILFLMVISRRCFDAKKNMTYT